MPRAGTSWCAALPTQPTPHSIGLATLHEPRTFKAHTKTRTRVIGGGPCTLRGQFVVLNAAASSAKASDEFNHMRGLNRQEFLCMLVRAAVMCYVMKGVTQDVVEALRMLLADVIPRVRALEPAALTPANEFRRANCYTKATSNCLQTHAGVLRMIFDCYTTGKEGKGADGGRREALEFNATNLLGLVRRLLSIQRPLSVALTLVAGCWPVAWAAGRLPWLSSEATQSRLACAQDEWHDFLNDFALIDEQLTEREATRCFVGCRLRVVNEGSKHGRKRLLQLSYEDFLEALVRIATLKALPTDIDVHDGVVLGGGSERHQCADGGELLLHLMSQGPVVYASFLRSHEPPAHGPPLQPTHRALHHLCCYLIRALPHENISSDVRALGAKVSLGLVSKFKKLASRATRCSKE
jgi:hypothetical protein